MASNPESVISNLMEMGFPKEKVELALKKSGGSADVSTVMDYILNHDEELENELLQPHLNMEEDKATEATEVDASNEDQESKEESVAKSIKCTDCGKLFKDHAEVEFHAAKTGHQNYDESTEEKKPLTDEEKKEQLAKIEAKLRQRRLDREAREKQEELEREKIRIKSGKELLEAKKKYEEQEMKKILDQRKREKEEERLARQKVKEQIEQDKLARKAKFSGEEVPKTVVSAPTVVTPKPKNDYSSVRLQIRLTDGSSLTQTFQPKEPLSAVRVYVEMNRKDAVGPFNLMTSFPKKVFTEDDYEKPLESLGLAPTATLIVSKSVQL